MRSGPKAIHYQGTLFRVSELVWVKVCPLPIWRRAIKYALMLLGIAFVYAVAKAKGTPWNIEGVLGFLAFHIGYCLRGDTRLATSGDLTESYDARGTEGEKSTFGQWVQALGDGPNECKLGNPKGSYYCWFNLERVAWARTNFTYDFYGLTALPIYLGYNWLIARNLQVKFSPILEDLKLLSFPEGDISQISMCCYAICALSFLAALTSLARVIEVRACGGLSDVFTVSQADQRKFFEKMAGLSGTEAEPAKKSEPARKADPAPKAAAPVAKPPETTKPEPAKEEPAPEPVAAESPTPAEATS
jgi:hypothetical protein